MSRIVVTTIGSLGDLHPKIAIALELQQRGHDVVFATHKEYQSKPFASALIYPKFPVLNKPRFSVFV